MCAHGEKEKGMSCLIFWEVGSEGSLSVQEKERWVGKGGLKKFMRKKDKKTREKKRKNHSWEEQREKGEEEERK